MARLAWSIVAVCLTVATAPRAVAQEYLQGSTALVSSCTGTYYDSGGPSGQYTNSESSMMTFCDPSSVGPMRMSFSSFVTESCCDSLTIYDGADASGTALGTFRGSSSPGVVSATGPCLTFVWSSDGSVLADGWAATISCGGTTGRENGAPCATSSGCDSGYCVDGVCCSSSCGGGDTEDCQACSVTAGGPVNGVCEPVSDGVACADGLMCNGSETCFGGSCMSAGSLDCDDLDDCTTDSCVEGIGCRNDAIPGCAGVDSGVSRDAGPRVDSSVPARDAGPLVRGRTGRSRGCCAVAGDDTGDPHGWLTALAFLLAGSLRWRRRRS